MQYENSRLVKREKKMVVVKKNENRRLVEGKMQYENSRLVKKEKKMVVIKKI